MSDTLFAQLRQLDLGRSDFAVFGSGPLAIREIIPECNDLDVLCRLDAWKVVSKIGEIQYLAEYDVNIVEIAGGAITFGTRWGIGNFNIDELIDTAEIIDELPFVRLQHVVAYKKIRSSPRDLAHLEALASSDFSP